MTVAKHHRVDERVRSDGQVGTSARRGNVGEKRALALAAFDIARHRSDADGFGLIEVFGGGMACLEDRRPQLFLEVVERCSLHMDRTRPSVIRAVTVLTVVFQPVEVGQALPP